MIGIGRSSFLIGVLVDVSGSMTSSIGSSGRQGINRLEAFSDALENLVHKAADSVHELPNRDFPVKVRLFAYGFGFGGLLSFLGNSGPAVRDLLAPNGVGERTVDIVELAENWQAHYANVRSMTLSMFGSTPMREAFGLAKNRIRAELAHEPSMSVLFVLSEGAY